MSRKQWTELERWCAIAIAAIGLVQIAAQAGKLFSKK
jgi:hypothetical protein